jgi:hypothetical protein
MKKLQTALNTGLLLAFISTGISCAQAIELRRALG